MKRLFALAGMVFILSNSVLFAQDVALNDDKQESFYFSNAFDKTKLSEVSEDNISSHPFGLVTAKYMYLLRKTYTYTEPATPTSPTNKTGIHKPLIYNSLLKLNRHYKRQFRKDNITVEKAAGELNSFLEIGLSVYSENTASLEQALRKAKKPGSIIRVFSQVVIE